MTSKESLHPTTRHWSCSTLRDGVDCLLQEADQIEAEELDLKKIMEDRRDFWFTYIPQLWNV